MKHTTENDSTETLARASIAHTLYTRQGPLWWYLLWLLVWAIGFGLLALSLVGCTHTIGAEGPRAGVSSASVVTLLRVHRAVPCATSYAGEPCRLADTWEPACSAFAVKGDRGAVLLVTAAHCAPQALGTELRYYAPNGIGHDRALLVARDAVHDLAVLEPRTPDALVALEQAQVPSEGESVNSVSSVYDGSSRGALVAELGQGFYETSQTIIFGWSGSPALDGTSRVWGVVSRCPTEQAGVSARCVAGHTYVASLGAL